MTIGSNPRRTAPVLGNDSNLIFAFNFLIVSESHALVEKRDTGTGSITTAVLGVDYSVQGVNNPSGGTITYTTTHGAPSGTVETMITGIEPITSETAGGANFSDLDTVQQGVDRSTREIQQVDTTARRAALFESVFAGANANSLPTIPRIESGDVNKLLGIATDVAPFTFGFFSALPVGSLVSTAHGEAILASASAAATRTILALVIGTDIVSKSVFDGRMTMLAETVSKATGVFAGYDNAWATVDVSTEAPSGKFAILRVRQIAKYDDNDITGDGDATISFRKTGTTPTLPDKTVISLTDPGGTDVNRETVEAMVVVELDGSQNFDFRPTEAITGTPTALTFDITIVGFYT